MRFAAAIPIGTEATTTAVPLACILARLADAERSDMSGAMLRAAAPGDMNAAPVPAFIQTMAWRLPRQPGAWTVTAGRFFRGCVQADRSGGQPNHRYRGLLAVPDGPRR